MFFLEIQGFYVLCMYLCTFVLYCVLYCTYVLYYVLIYLAPEMKYISPPSFQIFKVTYFLNSPFLGDTRYFLGDTRCFFLEIQGFYVLCMYLCTFVLYCTYVLYYVLIYLAPEMRYISPPSFQIFKVTYFLNSPFLGDTMFFFWRYKVFFWGNSLRNFSRSLPFPQTTGKNADLKGEKNPRKAEFLQCKSVRSPHSRECPKIVLFSGMPKNNRILRNAQQKVLFSGMPQKIVLFSGMPKNTSIAEFL